jgi:hypothetical protein
MADAPPPGVKSLRSFSRVNIFRMLGDRVTSSSISSTVEGPSHDPSSEPECSANSTFCFFLRMLWLGKWSFSAVLSLFRPHEVWVIHLSRAVRVWEGGCPHCSTIMQSGAGGCKACATWPFPRSGVLVRSGVFAFSYTGDWVLLDLADRSVLFLRTCDDRVHSGTGVFLSSGTLPVSCCPDAPAAWLGSAAAWEVGMSSNSPATSYRLAGGEPGLPGSNNCTGILREAGASVLPFTISSSIAST